jgi:hypothetical protein
VHPNASWSNGRRRAWFAVPPSAALVLFLFAWPAPAAAPVDAKDEPEPGWDVKPDPLPDPVKGPFETKASIPVAFMGQVVFPTRPSAFVAVTPAGTKDRMVVYDLRTMKPVGKPIETKFNHDALVLSSDGAYLAGLVRDKDLPHLPVVEVWSVAEGKSLRTIPLDDKRMDVGLLDFAGKDQIVTEKATQPDVTYQLWDVTTGKELQHFTYRLEFNRKWAALSPGGRYLLMEETDTLSGYHMLCWDLAAGKKAGDVELQGPKEEWGQACGISFSPDGEEVAMLWRLGHKDVWGRLFCWNVKTGKKTLNLAIPKILKDQDSLWFHGGPRVVQWIPDRSGWWLFGNLLIEHDTGAAIGTTPPEPNSLGPDDRRILDPDHVTAEGGGPFDKMLGVGTLPREEIDAAIKKARDQKAPPK